MPAPPSSTRVCVGQFAGAHGVRGLLRLKSFTQDPADVARYGPVETEDAARRFALDVVGQAKGVLIVRVAGVTARDQAAALAGTRLYVARACLPAPAADEFYQADLIGLGVEDPAGAPLGTIRAVDDFGAGPVLELTLADGRAVMVPFTRAVVTEIDVARGRAVVALPAGLLDDARPSDADRDLSEDAA
ncbi:MAG TPA: ribosome maturation factor RimM [Candidatus Sulfotelmatobacter sp.]|nr:ribosome maturation factor RimM [Candidatus Sulfotelmatobacter sp.]